jgi:hypothetical protein
VESARRFDKRLGETIMAGICPICGQPNNARDYVYCTMCKDQAREAELNSGRQEKLPFAQLVLKPTIADNYIPGNYKPKTASATMNQNWSASENGYYDMKYGVHVPAGGKIKVESVEMFDNWICITVIDKFGNVHSTKNMSYFETYEQNKKYPDTDPDKDKLYGMKFYPAHLSEI